jgi:hypothetical protein
MIEGTFLQMSLANAPKTEPAINIIIFCYLFNKNGPKCVPKYNHNYKER